MQQILFHYIKATWNIRIKEEIMTEIYKKLNEKELEVREERISILEKEDLINERDYYSSMFNKVNSKIALFDLKK